MCGENELQDMVGLIIVGSPPRVRGKLTERTAKLSALRITPACAGKTGFLVVAAHGSKDHPRVCGENQPQLNSSFQALGSPPRVRGKLDYELTDEETEGITPACAGKTTQPIRDVREKQDHPRVCGENIKLTTSGKSARGSPPRVRGKRWQNGVKSRHCRITPACAGKTQRRRGTKGCNRDHPRVCGENRGGRCGLCGLLGSPPRVRGKHFGNGVFPWLILVLSLDPL